MKTLRFFLASLTLSLFIATGTASAQRCAVAANVADMLALGTISAEAYMAVDQHFSINAAGSVNPWTFHKSRPKQFQDRKQTYSVGMRWWPWNVYSGWWMGARGQYQEYNRGGVLKPETEEGDAVGLALSGGYSLMLATHFNLDFGLGLWGGHSWYTTYACPSCGRITDSGKKWFILPSDLLISLVYTF